MVDTDGHGTGDTDGYRTAATDWSVLESNVEYDCDWFTVGFDLVERPDGETANYYWVDPPDGVSIVAVTDGEVVLVEQHRPRQQETFLSCPMGRVDRDESFTEAGVRELREETGFESNRARLLQSYYSAGWLRQKRGVVFADELTAGEQDLDDGEFLRVRTVPVEQALAKVRSDPANEWTLLPLMVAEQEGLL